MWVACSSEKGVFSRSSDTPLPLVVLIVDTRLTTNCIIPPRSLKYDYVGGANAKLESLYDLIARELMDETGMYQGREHTYQPAKNDK